MYQSQDISLNKGWKLSARVDQDGHLNIFVSNEESKVIFDWEHDPDTGVEGEHGLRFTTQKIEDEYRKEVYGEDVKVLAWFKTDDESYELDEFDATFYIEHLKDEALQEMIDQGYSNDDAFDAMAEFYTIGSHKIELINDGLWHSSKASKHGKEIGYQCGVHKETFIEWLKVHRPHLVPERSE